MDRAEKSPSMSCSLRQPSSLLSHPEIHRITPSRVLSATIPAFCSRYRYIHWNKPFPRGSAREHLPSFMPTQMTERLIGCMWPTRTGSTTEARQQPLSLLGYVCFLLEEGSSEQIRRSRKRGDEFVQLNEGQGASCWSACPYASSSVSMV